ncbi:NUDIX hydrolase [Erysipelothrix urinaevulpis]|uniref:NUDIX hydrolase n=1 Tax=Erysipelothrix urinaevulpis TaxID=2683717 RepID=UPI001356D774|nr:NUDIX hydrolase [Erysipelothrix urinaevulpis]
MKRVNIIIVFDPTETNILMCHRQKEPYKGLYNFVGGKQIDGETDKEGAYRELFEETGIKRSDINLEYLYKTQYYIDQIELQVFFGTLKHEVELIEEAHPLLWMNLEKNFADESKFAGEGNIKHMLLLIKAIHERSRQD